MKARKRTCNPVRPPRCSGIGHSGLERWERHTRVSFFYSKGVMEARPSDKHPAQGNALGWMLLPLRGLS